MEQQKQGAPLVCLPSGKKQKNQEVEVNFFWNYETRSCKTRIIGLAADSMRPKAVK